MIFLFVPFWLSDSGYVYCVGCLSGWVLTCFLLLCLLGLSSAALPLLGLSDSSLCSACHLLLCLPRFVLALSNSLFINQCMSCRALIPFVLQVLLLSSTALLARQLLGLAVEVCVLCWSFQFLLFLHVNWHSSVSCFVPCPGSLLVRCASVSLADKVRHAFISLLYYLCVPVLLLVGLSFRSHNIAWCFRRRIFI